MEEREKALAQLDRALCWLLVIVAATLLSFAATARQRQAACLSAGGCDKLARAVGDVRGTRLLVSLLIVPALSWFFLLSLEAERTAWAAGDGEARRSACLNRWAAFFTLLAAGLRLIDNRRQCCLQTETEQRSVSL